MPQEPQQPELRFGASQDDFHMKLQHQKQAARFPSHNINLNMNCINNNNIPSSVNNNVSTKNNAVQSTTHSKSSICDEEKDDYLLEFSGNKSDPKYQTLPYKFSPNSIPTSTSTLLPTPVTISSKLQKAENGSIMDGINKGNAPTGSARGVSPLQGNKISNADLLSQHQTFNKQQAPNSSIPTSIANLQPRYYVLFNSDL